MAFRALIRWFIVFWWGVLVLAGEARAQFMALPVWNACKETGNTYQLPSGDYEVPVGCFQVRFRIWGAGGGGGGGGASAGAGHGGNGGTGAYTEFVVQLAHSASSRKFSVVAGRGGIYGDVLDAGGTRGSVGNGGGGGTVTKLIYKNGDNTPYTVAAVGAGGGGGGGNNAAEVGGNGGSAGATGNDGVTGEATSGYSSTNSNGKGATTSAGGSRGTHASFPGSPTDNSLSGDLNDGGRGGGPGYVPNSDGTAVGAGGRADFSTTQPGGGGGGGGRYGGGGGNMAASNNMAGAGGGGGSSTIATAAIPNVSISTIAAPCTPSLNGCPPLRTGYSFGGDGGTYQSGDPLKARGTAGGDAYVEAIIEH